ncbi:MAG: zinc ribbon domain-containing protein [Gemmatimonadales bacterium]
MGLEVAAAVAVAIAALWVVLQPLVQKPSSGFGPLEPLDPEETTKGVALAALKEIEFDRETGKLSDADYAFLKAKYTGAALDALRQEERGAASDDVEALIAARVRSLRSASAVTSPDTHPDVSVARPLQVSSCPPACLTCGPRPEADAIFCSTCGLRLPGSLACDRCGTALLPGSRFCEACGRPVAA